MVNHISQALFIKSDKGTFTYISTNAATLLHLTADEVIGKSEADLFGHDIGFDGWQVDQQVMVSKRPSTAELQLDINGEIHLFSVVKHPHLSTTGEVQGIIGSIEKIAEDGPELAQKPAHGTKPTPDASPDLAALTRGLLTVQTAVTAMSQSLNESHLLDTFLWEITNFLEANGAFVFKWQEEEDVLQPIAIYGQDKWQEDAQNNHLTFDLQQHLPLKRLLEERNSQQWPHPLNEFPTETDYLKQFNAQVLLLMPLIYQAKIIGLTVICRQTPNTPFTDLQITLGQLLTDQAAGFIINASLYSELTQTNESLRASNAELDAFAHTVAHDLKSPLTSSIGFTNILIKEARSLPAKEIQEFLNIVHENGLAMEKIIDGLLMLASVRKEDVSLNIIHMETVVTEVIARFYYQIRETGTHIHAATKWLPCHGFRPWIEEVWANLISNAIKYGSNPPYIMIGCEAQPEGMVKYWVKDNGQGLSEQEQAKLFIPFTRLGQHDGLGHGLGLSIVQRIVNRLDGEVGVSSEVGIGSTFYFTLPAAPNESKVNA